MKKILFTWVAVSIMATMPQGVLAADIDISQTPIFVSEAVPPLSMLVMGRDHSLFFEAYNDASDIDGDGELDLRFKPSIEYYGIFDSNLCYTHSGGETNNAFFSPAGITSALTIPSRACPGQWSGNWLNYVTTSRIDALRKVLYGGHRDVDTATQTILRRAYIPQDGHSWAKEYTSPAIDQYEISKYTPLALPSSGTRHFFGNLTKGGTNCSTLDTCSSKPPLLSVIRNSTVRVWDWASSERPVLSDTTHKGTRNNYTVRVEVCNNTYKENCKKYQNGNYKPIGLLHEYGENSSMLFGLLTGSYNKNMSGGVLRKVISFFKDEVNIETGTFTTSATIVNTIDKLRIRDFNNGKTDNSYRTGSIRTRAMNEGEFVDWGNPIGEMMYETLRYFAGKGAPTGVFNTSGSHDAAVGLSAATWDNPYASDSEAKAQRCAKPNMIVMSSVNVSYDSDQLPGSAFGSFTGDLRNLDVSKQADAITQLEPDVKGLKFIGAVGSNEDFAPTAKTVTSLGNIRGLAPEEPTKQGSYYSASIARYGSKTDLSATTGDQKADTYIVALASQLPGFVFTISSGSTQKTISMVPFAKTINGSSVDRTKGKYQPTDPIVDLYIEEYSSTKAKFRINFEADEQGNDFDMDVVAEYTVEVVSGQLKITVKPVYQGTGSNQNLGYVISGTDRDGTYLVAQDKSINLKYFLNVPPGHDAGYCNYDTEAEMPDACKRLPWINGTGTLNGASASQSEQLFTPSSNTAATILKNPLWYAAKYGRSTTKWDTDGDGIPDNYFLVTNALTLKEQLDKAFNDLVQNNKSVARPAAGREPAEKGTIDKKMAIYRSTFELKDWSGELIKETIDTAGIKKEEWRASDNIPRPADRKIKMANAAGTLTDFTWSNLSGRSFDGKNLQAVLNTAPGANGATDNYGPARVQFVRGEACTASGCDTFRKDAPRLGDFIGSAPVVVAGAQYLSYIAETLNGTAGDYRAFKEAQEAKEEQGTEAARPGRQPMVYIGANDGMLHAFNTTSGAEVFAFVPTAVIENLNKLPQSDYTSQANKHQYYVDGAITVRDVYYSGAWHTVLVGALGAGGREVYALDITNPYAINLLWEFTTDSPGSKICSGGVCQPSDLGYSIPAPTIARLHNGKWNVVISNGYNSPNGDSGKAVLFILDIETGALVKRLDAAGTANISNGLSSAKLADNNSDGIADYAYAGDIQGNLWRFDLIGSANRNDDPAGGVVKAFNISSTPWTVADEFKVSFSGKPLYTAITKDKTAQSITSAPSLIRHPTRVGYIVAFGTGRYLGSIDKDSPFGMDTLYGIWDKQTRGQNAQSTTSLDRSVLQQQTLTQKIETFTATSTAADGTPVTTTTTRTVRLLTQTDVRWHIGSGLDTDGDKYGWYLDLATSETSDGERIVDNMIKAGGVLLVPSLTPNSDACESGIDGFYYGLDPATGGRTTFNVFDLNSDGKIDSKDQSGINVVTGFQAPAGGITLTDGEKPGDPPCLRGPDGECMGTNLGPNANGRQSWRITPNTPPAP